MEKSIRVEVMGRQYALRVQSDNESLMREVADRVNTRMMRFRETHPDQSRLTAAVITALALGEEAHRLRHASESRSEETEAALLDLAHQLEDTLPPENEETANP